VDIGDYRADIPRCRGNLENFDGILDGFVPMDVVSFIAEVNFLSAVGRDHHLGMCAHKFSDGRIKACNVMAYHLVRIVAAEQ